jgi:hypothetical protein
VIPQFPDLKKLEASDKQEVETFTATFPPYSDFNFISMWSWDTSGEMALSQLNGNLVVRFTDYITGEPFYSFIGTTDADATARMLLETSARQGLAPVLRLIPNDVATALDANIFGIEAKPDHADYVLSVDRLRTYGGGAFKMVRNNLRKFLKNTPLARFEVLDLQRPEIRRDLERLFALWFANKNAAVIDDNEHEYAAFSRCLDPQLSSHLISYGVYAGDALIAFLLMENIGDGFAIVHFEKADTNTYAGIMPFLRQQAAHAVSEQGIRYINLEQDLGIEGLRVSKASYAPDHYLKKYAVRFF